MEYIEGVRSWVRVAQSLKIGSEIADGMDAADQRRNSLRLCIHVPSKSIKPTDTSRPSGLRALITIHAAISRSVPSGNRFDAFVRIKHATVESRRLRVDRNCGAYRPSRDLRTGGKHYSDRSGLATRQRDRRSRGPLSPPTSICAQDRPSPVVRV